MSGDLQPRSAGRPRLRSRRISAVLASGAAVVLAVIVALAVGPQPMHVGAQTGGDGVLAGRVRAVLDADGSAASTAGYRGIAVGVVDHGTSTWAGLGNRGDGFAPTNTTSFEIGSITKLFTGLLLADAVDRKEVRLVDQLDRYLPQLAGSPAGGATLEELATHTSGLPAYADDLTGATYEGYGHSDVEGLTADKVIAQTAGLRLSGRGTHQYSNLGVTLLGAAVANAAGADSWTGLVTERVLKPAGMTRTVFVARQSEVPNAAAVGSRLNGLVAPYSVGPGYLPAGTATFSTVDDLAAFAMWVLDGRAIGLSALEPRLELGGGDAIGLVWLTHEGSAWHNGSVPGFTATLRLDRAAQRAVVALGNTDASVEPVGVTLLVATQMMLVFEPLLLKIVALGGLVILVGCVLLAARSRSVWAGVGVALASQSGLVLLLRFAPWQRLPVWTWGAAAAVVAVTTILAADQHRRTAGGISVALALGLVAAAVLYGVTVWVAG